MSQTVTLEIADEAGTVELGRKLGQLLLPGAVVALMGPLGAGKTCLVRAVAEGLGIADARVVASPTFVLIHEYQARLPIYHFDAYRLKSPAEFAELGVHEYFEGRGVCLIEWADRVESCLPADHLRIALEIAGPTARRIVLAGRGVQADAIVGMLE